MKKIFNIALLSVFVSGIYIGTFMCDEDQQAENAHDSGEVSESKNGIKSKKGISARKKSRNFSRLSVAEKSRYFDKGYWKVLKAGYSLGRNDEREDMRKYGMEKVKAFSNINGVAKEYSEDEMVKYIWGIIQTSRNDIDQLIFYQNIFSSEEKDGIDIFYDAALSFVSYKDVENYSKFQEDNGTITVKAIDRRSNLAETDNKHEKLNILIALKWTLSIYKSIYDYNGIALDRGDIVKIYDTIMKLIKHATRSTLTISPKIERVGDYETGVKYLATKAAKKSFVLEIKLKDRIGVFPGVLRLSGTGYGASKAGREKRGISVDLFMPNKIDIKGLLGKRFYIDKSKPIDDEVNKEWQGIKELKSLFKEDVDCWKPRVSDPDFKVKEIKLNDILEICVNGNVKCNKTVNGNYTKTYIPDYIDFIGFGNAYKGAYLLRQQKGRIVSELFKKDNKDGTYTVVLGVIKRGKARANIKTAGIKAKNVFNGFFGAISESINRNTKKYKANDDKTPVHDTVNNVHNVIYILTVNGDVYRDFIKRAEKYDQI